MDYRAVDCFNTKWRGKVFIFGDTHGKSWRLFRFLLEQGLLKRFTHGDGGKIIELMRKENPTAAEINEFIALLFSCQVAKNIDDDPIFKIILLGDTIMERFGNDIFMLIFYKYLLQNDLLEGYLLSNHDILFLKFYLDHLDQLARSGITEQECEKMLKDFLNAFYGRELSVHELLSFSSGFKLVKLFATMPTLEMIIDCQKYSLLALVAEVRDVLLKRIRLMSIQQGRQNVVVCTHAPCVLGGWGLQDRSFSVFSELGLSVPPATFPSEQEVYRFCYIVASKLNEEFPDPAAMVNLLCAPSTTITTRTEDAAKSFFEERLNRIVLIRYNGTLISAIKQIFGHHTPEQAVPPAAGCCLNSSPNDPLAPLPYSMDYFVSPQFASSGPWSLFYCRNEEDDKVKRGHKRPRMPFLKIGGGLGDSPPEQGDVPLPPALRLRA